jgi:hypothetical protein
MTGYVQRHHIALLALFLALGGTSVAASNALLPRNSVGTAQLKNGAVTKKKINKKTVRALRGNRGAPGEQGAQGIQGVQGAQGVPGTARAYGLVNLSGTTVTRSKGVVSVSRPGTGVYCILLDPSITFSATGAVSSPNYIDDTTGPTSIAHTELLSSSPDCPDGNYLNVRTFRVTANTTLVNTPQNQGFFFAVP